jgi:hypothetical protein
MPNASAPMRFLTRLLVLVLLLSMAGVAMASKKRATLEKNQYAYSAAIRWGDFEGAWSLVDPKVREEKPMSAADFSRYEQIQVTGYRDLGAMPGPDPGTQMREIQIEVVNRNTLTQRRVRYTEVWHYDAKAKTWWIASLPNFWDGR